jgi:hypothetical protein
VDKKISLDCRVTPNENWNMESSSYAMNRLRIAHIVIAVVLACPYLCMGEMSGSPFATCARGCDCSQNEPEPESPGTPADHDPDCLCHGAVVDGGLRTANLDSATLLTLSGLVAETKLGSAGAVHTSIAFEPPHHFPPFSTGRDVCALTCTLLL